MHVTRIRLLGGAFLAAAIALAAGDAPDAFAQKKEQKPTPKKADPTKKVTGTLAADAKLSAEQLAQHIDKLIVKRLKEDKIDASPVCSDEDFVRRIYLDLMGKIPTAEQAAKFLDSKETNKRAKLIDELLESKDFGKHLADVWQAMLLPRDSDNVRLRQWYPRLEEWLAKEFNDNRGWDKTVKDFMTATGDVEKNGPVIYWLANNTSDKMTDNVTRMFMGVQLQCAQCHNHPFTDYKQNEYWHMAAFFAKVGPDGNPKAAAKNGSTISVSESSRPRRKQANPDA